MPVFDLTLDKGLVFHKTLDDLSGVARCQEAIDDLLTRRQKYSQQQQGNCGRRRGRNRDQWG